MSEYTKQEAIKVASEFIAEVNLLEKKYNMSFNSDTGDVYLSFKCKGEEKTYPDTISLGWIGDGSGIKVMEKTKEALRQEALKQEALNKLTLEEREVLGLL